MIFLGDLACPKERVEDFNRAVDSLSVLDDEILIINLEAVILDEGKQVKTETLYNHPQVLETLKRKAGKVIVSLANNHMYDYPEEILPTKEFLESHGIGVFGLREPDGRVLPFEFNHNGIEYAFFGHSWNLYSRTNPNKTNDVRIVDIEYRDFLTVVTNHIQNNPQRQVFCFMHWNYDLEKLPFPMHIKLAHALIDSGVSGVIGSHSHVCQGVELYKNRPIAYCLGNFYLPSGIFFDGELTYPVSSKETIGINITDENYKILKFSTDCDVPVKYIETTDFCNLDNFIYPKGNQYIKFFKKNRVKRLLVPVFTEYNGIKYYFNRGFAVSRIKAIKTIQKILNR